MDWALQQQATPFSSINARGVSFYRKSCRSRAPEILAPNWS
jgi:hypothetical protein